MIRRRAAFVALTAGLLTVAAGAGVAAAQPAQPSATLPNGRFVPGTAASALVPILKDVGLDQKPGATVPLELPFFDEAGRQVRLADYTGQRPVILALVYYRCPMLCTQVLNGLVDALRDVSFTPGKDFDVVAVSFNAAETPALAAEKKRVYLERYGKGGAEGFHFLTGIDSNIQRLAASIGFKYAFDAEIGQFAHPAVITVLAPGGQVSRYLLGIEYASRDVRLALVEASSHQIGSVVDRALLYCYHYDPVSGKYGFVVLNIVRLGGIVTVLMLGTFIALALRREKPARVAA